MNRPLLTILLVSAFVLVSAMAGIFIIFFQSNNLTIPLEDLEIQHSISKLSVKGNLIVIGNNTAIVLRGAAIEDPAISSRELFFGAKEKDLEVFAEWGFNLIRIPINPERYGNDKDYLRKYVDPIVDTAPKKGIYVLLGWHGHGNPFTGEVELGKDGAPITLWQADMKLTKDFWMEASQRYAHNPTVLYSIYNEPAFMNWGEWKVGAEEIIEVIRKNDPEKIIFVSGVEWGSDLKEVGNNPINLENIVYEAHVYPSVYWKENPENPSEADNSSTWDKYFGYLAGTHPVFVGEWGYYPENEESGFAQAVYGTTEDYGRPLIEYMDEKRMSWSAWVWSDTWYPPMIKNGEYEPTEFGALVKESLQE